MFKGNIKENEVIYKFDVLLKNSDGTFSSFSNSEYKCGSNNPSICEIKYIASVGVAKEEPNREITINEPSDIFGVSADADYEGQPELIISSKPLNKKRRW